MPRAAGANHVGLCARTFLAAGNEPKLGALFAQAELNRGYCGQRDPIWPRHAEVSSALEGARQKAGVPPPRTLSGGSAFEEWILPTACRRPWRIRPIGS